MNILYCYIGRIIISVQKFFSRMTGSLVWVKCLKCVGDLAECMNGFSPTYFARKKLLCKIHRNAHTSTSSFTDFEQAMPSMSCVINAYLLTYLLTHTPTVDRS